jgi:hypothetical protein
MWSSHNRFNQTGYSSPTVFPKQENYCCMRDYLEDRDKAVARESTRKDWLEEQRLEAKEDEYYESLDLDEDGDLC